MCMGVCVSVCAWKRERVSCLLPSLALCFALSLFPPSLHFSSPLSGFSPLSSSTLSFYHLFLLCLCLSFSPSLPFFPPPPLLSLPLSLPLSPPLSFSSRASLLAVDVTEAEAEATLPLIGCHSQVSDKEKGREKNETKKHGGGKGEGGEARKYCPYIPVSISWLWNRETGEVRGWRRGWTLGRHTVFFLLFSYCECIHKAVRKGRHWKWLLRRIDCMMFDV